MSNLNLTSLTNKSKSAKPVQVIAITGGKGGVGKSNVAINLSYALKELGRRVMLLDADLSLANIDILLGLHAKHNLSHVLNGECSLEDIIITGPKSLPIVPAASGIQQMTNLSMLEHTNLIRAFSDLTLPLDNLIIDTAAGISDSVLSFLKASHEIILVVCNEPASIADAYALMKLLSTECSVTRFNVLANMVQTEQEGRELYQRLAKVADKFLDVTLRYMGDIPYDQTLRTAIKQRKIVLYESPKCKATKAFYQLAKKVSVWPKPNCSRGNIEFFIERLILASEPAYQGL